MSLAVVFAANHIAMPSLVNGRINKQMREIPRYGQERMGKSTSCGHPILLQMLENYNQLVDLVLLPRFSEK